MKRLVAVLMTAMLMSVLAVGCTTAKKPLPPQPVKPVPRSTTTTDLNKQASKLAAEAGKVNGVQSATVATSQTIAYVGINLKSNIEAGRTDAIKNEVKDRVRKAEPRVTKVYVSSDPDLVARIKKVATGISQGKPVSSFTSEIAEIGRRIAP